MEGTIELSKEVKTIFETFTFFFSWGFFYRFERN